jgi:hypothetical protein
MLYLLIFYSAREFPEKHEEILEMGKPERKGEFRKGEITR